MQQIAWTLRISLLGLILYPTNLFAETVELIANINTEASAFYSSNPTNKIVYGNDLYFVADDGKHGRELHRYNSEADQNYFVSDINIGVVGSEPKELTVFNNKLFFSADDGAHGRELYAYDSVTDKTVIVADIHTGATGSFPSSFTVYHGKLYFTAMNGSHGEELYVYNPDTGETSLVSDLNSGELGSSIHSLTVYQELLYFGANDGIHGNEFFVYDSTTNQTRLVADIVEGDGSSSASGFTEYRNKLYFSAYDSEGISSLYVYDKATNEVRLVADMPVNDTSYDRRTGLRDFTVFNDQLYFNTYDDLQWALNNHYIYAYDETTNQIRIIVGNRNVESLTVYQDKLYFKAAHSYQYGGIYVDEVHLYSVDDSDTIVLISDVFDADNYSTSKELTVYNGRLYFTWASEVYGMELLRYDAGTGKTDIAANIHVVEAGSNPTHLTNYNGNLYFFADNGVQGRELHSYDFENNSISLVGDLNHGHKDGSCYVGNVRGYQIKTTIHGGKLYFPADDGISGCELYSYDSTLGELSITNDIMQNGLGAITIGHQYYSHFSSSYPRDFVSIDDNLYFVGNTYANDPWQFDWADLFPGDIYDYADESGAAERINNEDLRYNMVLGSSLFNNKLLYSSNIQGYGYELAFINDETKIVSSVIDVCEGACSSFARVRLAVQDDLYFTANDENNNRELYVYNDTSKQLALVSEFGRNSAFYSEFVLYKNRVYFVGKDSEHGAELFAYDPSLKETLLVADINSGSASSFFEDSNWDGTAKNKLVVFNDKLYFIAESAEQGRELRVYDAITNEITTPKDINPGEESGALNILSAYNNKLYFNGFDGTSNKLYAYDDASMQVNLVIDQREQPINQAHVFEVFNNKAFFSMDDSTIGVEFYSLHTNHTTEGRLVVIGELIEGGSLSIEHDLSDKDGMGEINYQWYLDEQIITGETNRALVLTKDFVGRSVSVKASYRDGEGTLEELIAESGVVLSDFDGDGVADVNDPDDDNDGVNDSVDAYPFDPTRSINETSKDNSSSGGSTSILLFILSLLLLLKVKRHWFEQSSL